MAQTLYRPNNAKLSFNTHWLILQFGCYNMSFFNMPAIISDIKDTNHCDNIPSEITDGLNTEECFFGANRYGDNGYSKDYKGMMRLLIKITPKGYAALKASPVGEKEVLGDISAPIIPTRE